MKLNSISTIDDLISNDSFKRWILEKNVTDAQFWHQWLEEHPEKLELVATAKVLIVSIVDSNEVPDEQIEEQVVILRNAMQLFEKNSKERKTIDNSVGNSFRRKSSLILLLSQNNTWWKVAALLLLICVSSVLYNRFFSTKSVFKYERFLDETAKHGIEYQNNGDSTQKVILADGSEVMLERNSKLICSKGFNAGKREVYLSGEAFFKVAKNPAMPFIVYSKNIITKVLGTSFWIKLSDQRKACVIVKTGKVSVFKPESFKEADVSSPVLSGIILTPNQQVIYDVEHDQMNKSLVSAPKSFDNFSVNDFVFDATPVVQVFKKLQEAYGVNIILDEETLASCSVSASLGNESFYEKLSMICRIIHADYQTIDGSVIINSRGCK